MPRTCTICNHRDREAIERSLLAGESFRNIATRTGTSPSALVRHRADHLTASLVKAHEAKDVARAGSLLEDVRSGEGRAERLYSAAEGILVRSLEAKDLRTALMAIREARGVMGEARQYMELRGELSGELAPETGNPYGQTLYVLSLPRCNDPLDVIEASERMVAAVGRS